MLTVSFLCCMMYLFISKEVVPLSNRIKAIRESLKLSQREFGEKLGVSRDVISNIEYNRVPPKELLLRHICELYNVCLLYTSPSPRD